MHKVRKHNFDRKGRPGAALVEFSVVLPFVLMLLIGSIELGGAILTRHTLSEAARTGARVYSLKKKKTEADVYLAIKQVMDSAGLQNYAISLDPDPAVAVPQLTPLTVKVSINSKDCTWVTSPWFVRNQIISSQCTMPADMGESGSDPDVSGSGSAAPDVYDEDVTDEGIGLSDKELEQLLKDAKKLEIKAKRAQYKANKEAQNAADLQAIADLAAQKAAEEGTTKAATDAAKAQQDADSAADKAAQKQQDADEAWQAYQAALAKIP